MAAGGGRGVSAALAAFTPPSNDNADDRLTLIERRPPADFTAWLADLPGDAWPDGRFMVHIKDVRAGLAALFDECGTPATPQAQWWIADAAALAEQFVGVSGEPIVDIRLERVANDACWKFHIDNVFIRLVTTYFGPGTELVPDGFGQQARAAQRAYDGPLRRLQAGDVAIFRGGATGVVHRSPPIAQTGDVRAMLCLNVPSMTSPGLWTPGAGDA